MWCAFYVTSLLTNLSTCYIAESYYKKYKMAQDCSIDEGINPSHLDSLLSEYWLSIEEEITNKEDIARSLINGKAVIGAKLDTAVAHVVAAYEIEVDVRNPISDWIIHYFDSNDGTNFFYRQRPLSSYEMYSRNFIISR